MNKYVSEKNLEGFFEAGLLVNGYVNRADTTFNKDSMLDVGQLIAFIQASQPREWERYNRIYGSSSEGQFVSRVNKEISGHGLIKVLREGIKDRGFQFKIAFFKPETTINEEDSRRYESNILSCVRQFHYSIKNSNTIDMVLLLNGIPIIVIEFKNQTTGQNIENAKAQLMYDRDPNEPFFRFNERNLVYFGVDNWNVCMTTRLAGPKTRFLPFDQGSNGPGNVGGKGNPVNLDGYSTSYLWEKVLAKDSLMEILHKFIHLEESEETNYKGERSRKQNVIFPRYHQLDVVKRIINDVRVNGPGKNYLIQHSAGSGKSNSIAWLAYRLSGLHDRNDKKIFDSVIVVTDRRVLDSQLQDTIFQFDHVTGVVERIDKDSAQLRDAINGGKPIIITTLQKFPVIYKEVAAVGKRNFAIIADEAHSSQTGISSQKLKEALGDRELSLEEFARMEGEVEKSIPDEEDELLNEMAAHGRHKNLSFFAFTATPKDKTLQMFGEKCEDGQYRSFHIYSMRQAIEEGFILDVLQNYTTYGVFYKMLKTAAEDPNVSVRSAVKNLTRFESLHPHNIEQKTEIMIEFFRANTKQKIKGRAKAMVVTASRLHAVRYYHAFKKYIHEKNYTDLDVLVAFSGSINDNGVEYTEEGLNRTKDGKVIREHQLRKYFREDFNTLIVAEKYQTGFDEPLLHTMFVDKHLNGVKAVQTLSRLNRTAPNKDDTFVLDFVNDIETIRKAFEPYYEATILTEGVDPNIIYDIKVRLDGYKLWNKEEIDRFAGIFYGKDDERANSGALSSILQMAAIRYNAMDETTDEGKEAKLQIKKDIGYFIRAYSFITQIERMFDEDMHKYYVYLKFLSKALPKVPVEKVEVDQLVILEYYKIVRADSGAIKLEAKPELSPMKGTGAGAKDLKEPLSVIVEKLNDRFGTNFTEMDKVLRQIANDMSADDEIVRFAKNNDQKTFSVLFDKKFEDIAADRYSQNDSFFEKMFKDADFMKEVKKELLRLVYQDLTSKKG
ncbi:MAG: type I restriction endonuclease subunit R [Methanomassiliicoccales archaeon]